MQIGVNNFGAVISDPLRQGSPSALSNAGLRSDFLSPRGFLANNKLIWPSHYPLHHCFACEDLKKSGFGGEHADSNHRLM
jgi:hypothetical protein